MTVAMGLVEASVLMLLLLYHFLLKLFFLGQGVGVEGVGPRALAAKETNKIRRSESLESHGASPQH